jgi:hypothetical protein
MIKNKEIFFTEISNKQDDKNYSNNKVLNTFKHPKSEDSAFKISQTDINNLREKFKLYNFTDNIIEKRHPKINQKSKKLSTEKLVIQKNNTKPFKNKFIQNKFKETQTNNTYSDKVVENFYNDKAIIDAGCSLNKFRLLPITHQKDIITPNLDVGMSSELRKLALLNNTKFLENVYLSSKWNKIRPVSGLFRNVVRNTFVNENIQENKILNLKNSQKICFNKNVKIKETPKYIYCNSTIDCDKDNQLIRLLKYKKRMQTSVKNKWKTQ